MVQEEALLIQMLQSRRIFVSGIGKTQPPQWVEGRCIQLSLGSEEERNNSASSRNHGETVWSQGRTPLLEEPCGSPRQPCPCSEQGWLDPGVTSGAAALPCSQSSLLLLLDAPRPSRQCQISFAGKGTMLIVLGVAVSWLCAGAEPRQLLCGSQPWCPGPCLPTVRAEQSASQPSGPSSEICPWPSSPSLQPGSVHVHQTEFFSCFCQLDPHGLHRTG